MTKIKGKNINLRSVEDEDADFILELRLKKGEFLSATNPSLDQQISWIKSYKKREENKEEYYFVIESKDGLRLGTARLYNINYDSQTFTFGSFIVDRDIAHKNCAPESMQEILNFSFSQLLLKKCLFDCRKNNIRANNFYKKFGAKRIDSDELNFYYEITTKI
ncbi:MAG: RimJ/RimL family protein N-acetyltransferase [Rickettsiales bacterium]|jgi:RimJ/RimL family protein N-acetyltransferase